MNGDVRVGAHRISLRLIGPFAVAGEGGDDLTPGSAKACALLALLATAPDRTRTRRWLEDKLWSGRGPEHAGASLRQTLSLLRRGFADYPGVFDADRTAVRLDRELVSVDLDTCGDAHFEDHEFLEGLDVRDPEFEEWLRMMRVRHSQSRCAVAVTSAAARPLLIRCLSGGQGTDSARIVSDMLSNQVAQHIGEHVVASPRSAMLDRDDRGSDLEIGCHVVEGETGAAAYFKVIHAPSGQVLYSRAHQVPDTSVALFGSVKLARAAFDAAEKVLTQLPHIDMPRDNLMRATLLADDAVAGIFTFDEARLREADKQLQEAFQLHANPAYIAWRALIRNVLAIETAAADVEPLKQEAHDLLDKALALGADNSLVLSLAALTRVMLFDDAEGALDLARPAMDTNPNSAFALQSISMAHMRAGNIESAYLTSQRGHEIASRSRYGHWWDLFHALACIAADQLDEAEKLARSAARRSPNFRPPLRALLALQSRRGAVRSASETMRRLIRVEPGFSLERYLQDEDYPNHTVRSAGLLELKSDSIAALRSVR